MKVKNLIKELQKYNPDYEVTITDGYKGYFYHTTNAAIKELKIDDEITIVDIGIGGCEEK